MLCVCTYIHEMLTILRCYNICVHTHLHNAHSKWSRYIEISNKGRNYNKYVNIYCDLYYVILLWRDIFSLLIKRDPRDVVYRSVEGACESMKHRGKEKDWKAFKGRGDFRHIRPSVNIRMYTAGHSCPWYCMFNDPPRVIASYIISWGEFLRELQ